MKMAGENKTLMLKAVAVKIETLRSNLEDKLEEVKDLQQKVKELVAIVRKSETKVIC
jgi:predicted  nucleic acid-binding Zn-ribbon protein